MIELKKVKKYYIKDKKQVNVINDINYVFNSNKMYCISGNSGSGKTTLIQILGLLIPINDGTLLLEEKDVKDLTEDDRATLRNKKIGFIFQSYYLNPLMKAYENVMLPSYINKDIKEESRMDIAYNLLEKVGLKGREKHYPKELSGGEQQRVAIARALINNPSIILADEPTGALDPENEKKVLEILKKLSKDGKCVIVVSHSKEIKKYADIVLEINNHKLVEVKK